jgi:hypothetical protein
VGLARALLGSCLRVCCVLGVLTLGGCAQTMAARAPLLLPAKVPVRVFPSIWVTGGDNPIENYLLDRLAAHLAKDGRREVRRVQVAELEPAREAGQINGTTAVLFLRASSQDSVRRYWDSMPTQYCGFYGCSTAFQSYMVTAIDVEAHAELTVYEGPTARVLQQELFERNLLGEDAEGLRQAVVDQLGVELERSVDVLRIRPRFELYRLRRLQEVSAALERIGKGDWSGGRAHLEVAAKQLGGQRKSVQARVWYNLGIARWAAPGALGLTREAYAAAHRALALAQSLVPAPHHQAALEELDKARQAFETLEAQRQATAHNFALAERQQGMGKGSSEAPQSAPAELPPLEPPPSMEQPGSAPTSPPTPAAP